MVIEEPNNLYHTGFDVDIHSGQNKQGGQQLQLDMWNFLDFVFAHANQAVPTLLSHECQDF